MNHALAGGLRERLFGTGGAGLGLGCVAAGDGSARLLDGAAQGALGGAIALGAHDALTVSFLCRRMIGHVQLAAFFASAFFASYPSGCTGNLGVCSSFLPLP